MAALVESDGCQWLYQRPRRRACRWRLRILGSDGARIGALIVVIVCAVLLATDLLRTVDPAGAFTQASCSRSAAQVVGDEQLLPRVAELYRAGYDDDAAARGYSAEALCGDLTGDGDQEMIVVMSCCTGGSLQPWGIFRHDSRGDWALSYASPRDNLRRRLRLISRGVKAIITARYEGGCTRRVRSHLVRWNGERFVGKLSRSYDLPRIAGCP